MYRIPVCNPYGSPNGYYSTHLFHAQCKRVCKSWRNFICQTPDFIVNFMRNTPVKTLLLNSADDVVLLTPKHGEFVKTPIMKTNNTNNRKSSSDDERLSIIGSCHGLTCVLLNTCKTHSERIYLFNLISAERIPDPLSNHVYHHNEKKETVYQFGFIPSANKFKLLRFVFNTRHHVCSNKNVPENIGDFDGLAIFTVKEDDDWRTLPVDSVSIRPSDIPAFVTFNGVVHWINYCGQIIRAFDLGQEKGGQISHPNVVKNLDALFEVKILKDHLSLMEYYWDDTPPGIRDSETLSIADEITVWTMKEYPIEESWTKDYIISINPSSYGVWWYSPFHLVAVLPTGDILFSSIYGNGYPVCYNPREKNWKLFPDVCSVSIQDYKIAGVPVPDLNPNLCLEE